MEEIENQESLTVVDHEGKRLFAENGIHEILLRRIYPDYENFEFNGSGSNYLMLKNVERERTVFLRSYAE